MIRGVVLTAALGGLAAVVAVTGADLDRGARAAARADEPVYLPRAAYLRPISLGWQNVLADILWFRAISYFGEHYRSNRTYPWLAQMCELVTDLDPRAEHVYRFGGVILPWEANQVDAGMHLLEKGTQQFPDSWTLEYYLGFQAYFFKSDYQSALTHLRRAMTLPDAHPAAARLATALAAEQYGPDTALAFLAELEHDAETRDLRDIIRGNIEDARLAADLERLSGAVAAYQTRNGYLPLTVETLVSARLLPAVPSDPFGGNYMIDPLTGAVRSSTGREPTRLYQSKMREKVLRGQAVREM